jgi:hypothetical protein
MFTKRMKIGDIPEGTYFRTLLTDKQGVVTDEALPGGDGGVRVLFWGLVEKVLHPDVVVVV